MQVEEVRRQEALRDERSISAEHHEQHAQAVQAIAQALPGGISRVPVDPTSGQQHVQAEHEQIDAEQRQRADEHAA